MNPGDGRFWTMDSFEGRLTDPFTLHKYLYANADPVNNLDPSGHEDMADLMVTTAITSVLASLVSPVISHVAGKALYDLVPKPVTAALGVLTPDAIMFGTSIQGTLAHPEFPLAGLNGCVGAEVLWSLFRQPRGAAFYGYLGWGINIGPSSTGVSAAFSLGAVYTCPDSFAYEGQFYQVTVPFRLVSNAIKFKVNEWYALQDAAQAGNGGAEILMWRQFKSLFFGGNGGISSALSFNLFWTPGNFVDGAKGFSFSWAFASRQAGGGLIGGANPSWTSEYYFQSAPFNSNGQETDVKFR
jgi:hypothetical protein